MGIYILYFILIVASVCDLRTFKIPNALSMIGVPVGLIVTWVQYGFFSHELMWNTIAVFGILIAFLPAWLLFGMGAGDVKLLMVIAAFLGFMPTVVIGIIAIFIASAIFLVIIPWKAVYEAFRSYLYLLFYGISVLSNRKEKKRLPFGVMILGACLLQTIALV